ncbi:permease [Nocardia sp. alder85J]|uniref:permease n=1 Tax=Nocardia sp. alder85J TaxID=2862949 RepID=UPI001CD47B08|nr:permease [Nocardia sp. alder85J]MCX4095102.1 permease [Nocardia sp. alder85J]
MTSHSVEQPVGVRPGANVWRHRILGALAFVVVLVLAYVLVAAFIPRWWAQRIAGMSGHGSFSRGIWSGLLLGVLCTAIPLLLLLFAATVWGKRGGRFLAGAAAVGAIVIALPNLMTLSIVLGGSSAAHAGERVLDVDAPGFRGATLSGAIVATLLFLLTAFLVLRGRFRLHQAAKRQLATQRAQSVGTPQDIDDTTRESKFRHADDGHPKT